MAALRMPEKFARFGRRFQRLFSTGQCQQGSFKAFLTEEEGLAKKTFDNWKKISFFIAAPACVFLGYKVFFVDHEEHPMEDSYIPYSHLKIRNKPFPWGDGDRSLFHNKHTNFGFENNEEEEVVDEVPKEEESIITKLIVEYLMDDPEKNRKTKNEHMALIRKRADEYLERKRHKNHPPEPIDLEEILRETVRPKERGVDGY
ncbi:uncharacterized protein LOC116612321 [Nematostella vectensis]|uniref:uncharacterized protein LOC116612321 n=1 Tax=Nematostella vectensis TaxID=45351 RepID=UPI00138FCBCB|nr:uncharacterized protein LOC116612321 [Nematostella vectensis]